MEIKVRGTCITCSGSGTINNSKDHEGEVTCPVCEGKKKLTEWVEVEVMSTLNTKEFKAPIKCIRFKNDEGPIHVK